MKRRLVGGVIVGVYGYNMLISVEARLALPFGAPGAKAYGTVGQILLIDGMVLAILGFCLTISAIVEPKKKR